MFEQWVLYWQYAADASFFGLAALWIEILFFFHEKCPSYGIVFLWDVYYCSIFVCTPVVQFYLWNTPGPLLLTWFIFNPSIDKNSRGQESVGWNYLSISSLQQLHRWCLGMDIHAGIKVNPC